VVSVHFMNLLYIRFTEVTSCAVLQLIKLFLAAVIRLRMSEHVPSADFVPSRKSWGSVVMYFTVLIFESCCSICDSSVILAFLVCEKPNIIVQSFISHMVL
jgi:hypothetical protein